MKRDQINMGSTTSKHSNGGYASGSERSANGGIPTTINNNSIVININKNYNVKIEWLTNHIYRHQS